MCEALCGRLGAADLYVVVVSNAKRQVPVWQQKAGRSFLGRAGFVCWDYHVFGLLDCRRVGGTGESPSPGCCVLDLDTLLEPWPCPFQRYCAEAFPQNVRLRGRLGDLELKRFFRLVPAAEFLQELRSDRSHMVDKCGCYSAQPPREPPIGGGGTNLFDAFVSMDPAKGFGKVLSEEEFLDEFSGQSHEAPTPTCDPKS
mmetsp:Transcript_11607/g.31084  ORF Transcript_11607/g.31084 Transcript_11607/m.31084 type:complete len:199 (-) Transcript_11607:57-653(-)